MKICIDQAPPQCQVGEGHMAACWLPVKEAREEEE